MAWLSQQLLCSAAESLLHAEGEEFLSVHVQFHKGLEVALKFIAISKECKYFYQLISEVQSVIHLGISLSDGKYSYQLSSIQACWHNLCLYAGRRAALCG